MKRLLLVTLILSALMLSVFASESFSVLVYPDNEEIRSYIPFFPTVLTDNSRTVSSAVKTAGEKLASAHTKESLSQIEQARKEYEQALATPIEQVVADVHLQNGSALDYNVQAMVAGDRRYLRYICEINRTDLVFIPAVTQIEGFYNITLYCYRYADDSFSLVYRRLSEDSNRFTLSCVLAMATLFGLNDSVLLYLDNLAEGTSLTVDGKTVVPTNGYILTQSGEHVISLDAIGCESRLISTSLQAGTISSLDAKMKSISYSALLIKSEPVAELRVEGVSLGNTPVLLDNYSLPVSMSLEAEGYAVKNIGLTTPKDSLSVSLKPLWMTDSSVLKQKKDAFYWDFARTLLMFGAKVALSSFNDGTSKVLSAIDGAASCALTVSLVDMVGSLIEYYRQTEYVSP